MQRRANSTKLFKITFVWILEHKDHFGNKQTDELAILGFAQCISNAELVTIPL